MFRTYSGGGGSFMDYLGDFLNRVFYFKVRVGVFCGGRLFIFIYGV